MKAQRGENADHGGKDFSFGYKTFKNQRKFNENSLQIFQNKFAILISFRHNQLRPSCVYHCKQRGFSIRWINKLREIFFHRN
jgi:hypothetical protein